VDPDVRSVLAGIESAMSWQEPRPETGTREAVAENVVEKRPARRRPYLLIVLLGVATAVAAGLAAWFLLRSDGGTAALPAPNSGAALVSQAQLERLAASVNHPVYWAGPKSGFSYELTMTSTGRIFIRYLPRGVKAGDPRPDFLVVGTYTLPGSFADLKRAGKRKGSVALGIDKGGIALFSSKRPSSVYFTYPGTKYQVEVYEPSGDTARRLVLAGQIKAL
jgi:hypothetical protein